MKQKGSILTVILIVVAVSVVVYFGYKNYWPKQQPLTVSTPITTSTPDPTANWKTLNNSTGKFSIKYPDTYTALGSGIEVDETTANEIIISQDPNDSINNLPTIHIDAVDKKDTVYKNMLLKDIVLADYEANKANKNVLMGAISEVKSITFVGEPAFTFEMESKGFSGEWHGFMSYTGINKVLEFEHQGIHYTVVYTKNSEFDQILSTFKLLD